MNKALIAGATGVVGRYLLKHLVRTRAWEIIAVSRRKPDIPGNYEHVAVDLLNGADCHAGLARLRDVTHVFFAAYVDRPTPQALVSANLAALRNLLEVVEETSPALQHVHLVEGTKWYGSHLGPFKSPAKESDPRIAQTLFYYDQQDYLESRQKGKRWSWSAIRPHTVCGFAVGNPMNLTTVIAVYAAICKELGLPFSHSGEPENYRILYQATDSDLLARAIEWMATSPNCVNQAFNVTNGDLFRWQDLWPKIAGVFE
ncbi:MAG: SDR family oxidoreductase, partial [Burkholderiales bacterium]